MALANLRPAYGIATWLKTVSIGGWRGLASRCGPEPPPPPAAAVAEAASSSTAAADAIPVERIMQRAITPAVCAALERQGFAVVDGVFGPEWSARLREELLSLRPHMQLNHTHLVEPDGSTGLLCKHSVHEAELQLPSTQALAPLCAQLQQDGTMRTLLSLFIPRLNLGHQAIKLQWNAGGGGCFPAHFDTYQSVDQRRVTAVWYLNPDWKEGDGGELRIYPWPAAEPINIAPLSDRLVLFSSQLLLHRVLPSTAERSCFTIWISGDRAGSPGGHHKPTLGSREAEERERLAIRAALAKDELGPEEAWSLAVHPQLYPHVLKSLYKEEWARSIEESHPAGPQRDQAMSTFWKEVAVVERALGPLLPALATRPPAGGPPRVQWL